MRAMNEERAALLRKLGRRVRDVRTRQQMSQDQLARASRILNTSYISKIERGLASASIEVLNAMAVALDVNLADLFDWDGKAQRPRSPRERPSVVRVASLVARRTEADVRMAADVLRRVFLELDKRRRT